MLVSAVDQPNVPPLTMPARFRTEIAFFMSPTGVKGAPEMAEGEYWIDPDEARHWLDEMVLYIVSPLDAENKAEIELTEDHETFLQWLITNNVRHVKLTS